MNGGISQATLGEVFGVDDPWMGDRVSVHLVQRLVVGSTSCSGRQQGSPVPFADLQGLHQAS
jgi:hypothetical protein